MYNLLPRIIALSLEARYFLSAVYISRHAEVVLYKHSGRLWLIVPLMLLWLFRVWLLASRGELDEDPVIFAIRDRTSWLLGAGVLLVALSSI